ncbi:hypothetical protein AAZX31_17G099900 [Glycine max]|uniref:Transmembrane protein n=1 Tax=Glycine soja TaxID=3848 RepID=A0A445G4Y5_GLYSO|nr:uncharacterized protein LOC114392540 [Glycine soja]KAG4930049.1 hypothetical protein JHK86_047010 [Glycine max]KAG4932813.1 hypothetical protein JHK87_046815 [Glycine soja]KAG5097266.1 hypothetical protein JHK82_047120 [Glycine max]KAG5102053.1 hypothetical protein JHK84_047022 [Glycine max]KAH1201786.1 hypothetical protein GmHk_17G048395 [Glycine max]
MEVSCKILRRSTHSFLQNYHYFTSTAAFLAFPFSASILLSQALVPSPSSLLPQIYSRLRTLFDAAGFPSSQLFTILNLKVSQTITSSILTLPFTLTFLLIAKASIIQALNHHKPTFPPSFKSILSLYKPLLHTYFCNCFLILSANASAFGLMFSAFSFIERLGYSSSPSGLILFMSVTGAILFSVILANAIVICNMALALSGMEGHGGYLAILKACLLLRGRTSMALFLALPVNVALAAIEALFQFRVVRPYHVAGITRPCVALEGIFIAYLYSIFIILDTVVSCMFYKSLKTGPLIGHEDKHLFRIEFPDEDKYGYMGTKELP